MQVAINKVRVDRFSEDVSRVLVSGPLYEGEVTGAYALLHPQLADRQVPYAPYARAPADTDGRAT
eukprot:9240118-Alexandrium_andersonii.AAC.1